MQEQGEARASRHGQGRTGTAPDGPSAGSAGASRVRKGNSGRARTRAEARDGCGERRGLQKQRGRRGDGGSQGNAGNEAARREEGDGDDDVGEEAGRRGRKTGPVQRRGRGGGDPGGAGVGVVAAVLPARGKRRRSGELRASGSTLSIRRWSSTAGMRKQRRGSGEWTSRRRQLVSKGARERDPDLIEREGERRAEWGMCAVGLGFYRGWGVMGEWGWPVPDWAFAQLGRPAGPSGPARGGGSFSSLRFLLLFIYFSDFVFF